jgi:hypothetical protein
MSERKRKRFEKGGFAHAGFADDVHMREAICLLDTEQLVIASMVRAGEVGHVVWIGLHLAMVRS